MAALLSAALVAGGCREPDRPDTPTVVLTEGRAGDQPWRLEGRRLGGVPCVTLVLTGPEGSGGSEGSGAERCGIRRTELRTLVPEGVVVGDRLLVFSPVEPRARRVRLDHADGSIRMVPARAAPGFPARFFLAELDPGEDPVEVRAFADGGRAVVR